MDYWKDVPGINEGTMSKNTFRGFHGEVNNRLNAGKDDSSIADKTFDKFVKLLAKKLNRSEREARDFLDSIDGRHFADSLSDDELAGKKAPNLDKNTVLKKGVKRFFKESSSGRTDALNAVKKAAKAVDNIEAIAKRAGVGLSQTGISPMIADILKKLKSIEYKIDASFDA